MQDDNRIVAVGLLTKADIALLGVSFDRLWPVDETPFFGALLAAIDEADRALWQFRNRQEATRGDQSDPLDTGTGQQSRLEVRSAPQK